MTLELQNISKSFDGLPVLRNLNLSFHQGQCYCLMSPSGSGKTTLLRILMGLEQPDQGMVLADGKPQDMNSLTVSAVFQEDRLCESVSPIENVSMCAGRSIKTPRIKMGTGPPASGGMPEPPCVHLKRRHEAPCSCHTGPSYPLPHPSHG